MLTALKNLLRPHATPAPGEPIGKPQRDVVRCYDASQQLKLVYYTCTYTFIGEATIHVNSADMLNTTTQLLNKLTESAVRAVVAEEDLTHTLELTEAHVTAITAKVKEELAKLGITVSTAEFAL